MARAAIAGCGLLALAACSGGTGETAPPTTVTTTTSAPPTTVAPSTTSAPTTTLSPQEQDEAEIRALHDRFFRMLVVTGNPPNPDHPEIAATTTGIQRQRWEEALRQLQFEGTYFDAEWSHRVERMTFSDDNHASVLTCALEQSRLLNADGSVAGTTDWARLNETLLVRSVDGWRIEDWLTGGEQTCVV
jgi:hypothetical protein